VKTSSKALPAIRRLLLGAFLTAALGVAACASPTLPLPPPFRPDVSQVDASGVVTLTGAPGAVPAGAVVYGYDLRDGRGDIFRAPDDGSFVLHVPAQAGDSISIWYEQGTVQSEALFVTVPKKTP
jgi:hypothetical protein